MGIFLAPLDKLDCVFYVLGLPDQCFLKPKVCLCGGLEDMSAHSLRLLP